MIRGLCLYALKHLKSVAGLAAMLKVVVEVLVVVLPSLPRHPVYLDSPHTNTAQHNGRCECTLIPAPHTHRE